ncbi:hypothetical protein [Funiculus sociatus]
MFAPLVGDARSYSESPALDRWSTVTALIIILDSLSEGNSAP